MNRHSAMHPVASDCFIRQPGSDEHIRIATMAYDLWRTHGGSAVANWLEAERVINAENAIKRKTAIVLVRPQSPIASDPNPDRPSQTSS